MARAANDGRAEDRRWHIRKDGSRFFADGVMVGLRGPAGELRGFGKVFRDATGQKRAEEALREAKREAEEANNAKTMFLAVLSHELRTPLNPILLAATAMLERPEEPVQLRPTLEMIRQNVMLQARLIDDLLDVMRIVRGKMPLHWEVADCHRLIEQAVQVCRSEVLGKGLRLEMDLAAREYHVNADPARLQQVFWNLIKNAVKFTPGRRVDHDPDPQRRRRAGWRGTTRHRGHATPASASASSRRSCPRSSIRSSRARRRSPASTAGWAWAWRSAGHHRGPRRHPRRRERGEGPGDDLPGRSQGPARPLGRGGQ